MSRTGIGALTRIEAIARRVTLCAGVALLAGCGAGSANLRAANNGQLAPCDGGPHCVSSLSTDPDRHVDPLTYTGARAAARQHLEKVVSAMDGAKIVEQTPDYIHATYTSKVFGFVDDVEFVLPAGSHKIQLRSSSRIGYYDFGVNRDRVETIRKRFEAPSS